VQVISWIGLIMALIAAGVAIESARRAVAASRRAADEAASARAFAQGAQRQMRAAEGRATAVEHLARDVVQSVDDAREHLALARAEAGNVGAVDVSWVRQWRHGPVFGLVCVRAEGHHTLHDVHMSIVAPRRQVAGVPAVAILGDSPVDIADAENRIGIPQQAGAPLPNVLKTDVAIGDLSPGEQWHAVLMCLSETELIILIMDWAVGPARDRERARADLALPPPLPSPGGPA
jgi:hypothetical protein